MVDVKRSSAEFSRKSSGAEVSRKPSDAEFSRKSSGAEFSRKSTGGELPIEESVASSSTKLDGENIIFHCILRDDQELLEKVFEDNQDIHHEQAIDQLNTRDSFGKSPLDLACMLGRTNILKILIKHGADLSSINASGYSPAHFAACWGHRGCLETLFEHKAHIDLPTKYEELPKQLALRYNFEDCRDFIETAHEIEVEAQTHKKASVDKKKSQQHHGKKKK